MKKRLMAAVLAGVMALSLAACGGSSSSSSAPAEETAETEETQEAEAPAEGEAQDAAAEAPAGEQTHIYVLTASEDHGWTGSVATFAKEKVEEVNAEGTYTAELITSASAAEQITTIEDMTLAEAVLKIRND